MQLLENMLSLKDAYKSLDEALTHGGIDNNLKVNLVRIDSENLKVSEIKKKLKSFWNFDTRWIWQKRNRGKN